jgi:hypothetical protein
MSDPLKDFKFSSGSGFYLGEFPVKIRVLTTDPMVHVEPKYGSTKFAFVVYNHDLQKAQIMDRGASIAQAIQKLHNDDEWGGDIQKIDIKITTEGTGKETRYTVTPLPNSKDLTNDQIREAQSINLIEKIKDGIRMSDINAGGTLSQIDVLEKAGEFKEVIVEDFEENEPVDFSKIPF